MTPPYKLFILKIARARGQAVVQTYHLAFWKSCRKLTKVSTGLKGVRVSICQTPPRRKESREILEGSGS